MTIKWISLTDHVRARPTTARIPGNFRETCKKKSHISMKHSLVPRVPVTSSTWTAEHVGVIGVLLVYTLPSPSSFWYRNDLRRRVDRCTDHETTRRVRHCIQGCSRRWLPFNCQRGAHNTGSAISFEPTPQFKTYLVAPGDRCAKIESFQGLSEAVLMSLNPGSSCADIFPGQLLCVAAPSGPPPTNFADPIPTLPPPLPEPVVPSVPCKTEIAVTLGDVCYDLATNHGLQLNQFMALNPKINCQNLQPGDTVCVFPACGEIYRVQPKNSCSSIEQKKNLPIGKLVQLNPSLDCNKLVPEQIVCVEDPPAAPTPKPALPNFSAWSGHPVLAPGRTLTQSPIMDFLNAKDPRNSFIGQTMFQFDSQHRKVFSMVDINGDGYIDKSEMNTLLNLYPVLLRGMGRFNASYSPENVTATAMAALDLNGDGLVSQDEYVFGTYKVQKVVQTAGSDSQALMRRDFPNLFVPGLLGLSAVQLSYVLSQMKAKSDADGSNLSDYLGIAFWDPRWTLPEPECSAVLYLSRSCGGIGSNPAVHCSEGGNRVFENSCRHDMGEGAFQCNMNGCSSLCFKINTNGCECDVLRYKQHNLVYFLDQPFVPMTTENNLNECRKLCSSNKLCIGFAVSELMDGATVWCRLYDAMKEPKSVPFGWVSFEKVPVSKSGNTCPPLTEGYRLSETQFEDAMDAGEKAAEDYANSVTRRDIVRRAPDSFDPRTKFKTPAKYQGNTQLCVSFTITTMVEASIMTKYNRKTVMELSPLWLAMCKAKQKSLDERNTFRRIRSILGSDYMATESCVPWSTRESPRCSNGCFSESYGELPYLTDSIHFQDAQTGEGVKEWDKMKEHLSTIGPLYSGFQISKGFARYSQEIASHSENLVFYDGHPDWPERDCPYGGHAMAIIGYGHFKKGGKGKDRLYWIVQNSWGISQGKFGYVYIAAGSLGQAMEPAYGVKVGERPLHIDL